MAHIVMLTRAAAEAYASAVDAALGYPRPGVDMGPGTHAPPAESRTLRYADIVKHPTLNRWAFPATPLVKGIGRPMPSGATEEELGDDWRPAQAQGRQP